MTDLHLNLRHHLNKSSWQVTSDKWQMTSDKWQVTDLYLNSHPVPSGYPNPTRYPVFLLIPDPTGFSFGNHRVEGNPKHRVNLKLRVLPDILGSTRKRKTIPSSGALLWDPQIGPHGAKICHFNVKYDFGTPLGWTIIVVQLTNHIYKHWSDLGRPMTYDNHPIHPFHPTHNTEWTK